MARELVTSDWHLGTFVKRRDQKRLTFLADLIQSVDQVRLIGDIWDGTKTTWLTFINSPWKELFPLLKNRDAVLTPGNHDWNFPRKPAAFWMNIEEDRQIIDNNGYRITAMHGHTLDSSSHVQDLLNYRMIRLFYPLGKIFEENAILKGPTSRFYRWYQTWNEEQKHHIKQWRQPNETVIVGHTHIAEEDPSNGYINIGFIDRRLKNPTYVLIENGLPRLVRHSQLRPQ